MHTDPDGQPDELVQIAPPHTGSTQALPSVVVTQKQLLKPPHPAVRQLGVTQLIRLAASAACGAMIDAIAGRTMPVTATRRISCRRETPAAGAPIGPSSRSCFA